MENFKYDSVTICDFNYNIVTISKFENSIPKSYYFWYIKTLLVADRDRHDEKHH